MPTSFARRLCALAIAAAGALAAGQGAVAQEDAFPSRAVRILVPYSVGGTSDTASRLVQDPLSRQLGQPVVVENRGGAGGLIATEAFFKLPPDGYTVLVAGAGPFAIIPPTRQVSYAVERDALPLGTIWRSPQVLVVGLKTGIASMADFVSRAKASPGRIVMGSAGVGALTHLSIELMKREAGIEVTHVPHRSTGDTLPALLGGHIDALFGDVSVLASNIEARTVTALAIAATRRSPLVPGLITMGEAGLPGVEAENWFGLVISTRTPPAVAARLQQAMLATQADPAYRASLAKQGASAGEPGREPFAGLIAAEVARWKPIVTAPGVKIE